jgi:hypothetical protein
VSLEQKTWLSDSTLFGSPKELPIVTCPDLYVQTLQTLTNDAFMAVMRPNSGRRSPPHVPSKSLAQCVPDSSKY